jgi:hypothetical protein
MKEINCFLSLGLGILIHFILCSPLNAQKVNPKETGMERIKKNSIYFEILGNAAVWSANYDRVLPLKNDVAMFIRVGGNQYHGKDTDKLSFNFLGATGILYGGSRHFFETGIGYTHFSDSPDRLVVLTVGYRFQGKKGFSFRTTPMYIYNSEKGDTFGNCLWFGLSFGYSF